MAENLSGNSQASRRSCENCRRKKTRCTGEKPVCSFCQRLQQQCYYLSRNGRRSRDAEFGPRQRKWPPKRGTQLGATGKSTSPMDAVSPIWANTYDEPPSDMLDNAVTVYRDRINFQPVSLFCPRNLRETLAKAPQFLQWTFLALTIMYSGGFTSDLSKLEAVKTQSESARMVVTQLAAKGNPKLEVSQSLCLMALADILAGEAGLAWMTLGLAGRLEVLRISQQKEAGTSADVEASSRCYWSIFSLENAFAPQSIPQFQDPNAPAYPSDMQIPQPVADEGRQVPLHDIAIMDDEHKQGSGIFAHSIRVLESFREVIKYLQGIRRGNVDQPWLPTSKFAELTQHLYELEDRLNYKHCFRNARFSDRSLDELHRDREYWRCWLLYQVRFHASHTLLNHPFVHLVALKTANRSSLPRGFLQISVDQALYHSSWVIRLVKMCIELGFTIYDPFAGDIVAAVATVPWIMQYARDRTVAARSKDHLNQCRNFLNSPSQLWPRIVQKVALLNQLQRMTDCMTSQNTISFQSTQLWQLLDPSLTELSEQTNVTPLNSTDQNTTMRVHTTFVHPVVEEEGADNFLKPDLGTSWLLGDLSQQFMFNDIFIQPLDFDQT